MNSDQNLLLDDSINVSPEAHLKAIREHQMQCEVRHIIWLRTQDRSVAGSYIRMLRDKCGEAETQQLLSMARDQFEKGNRGTWGEWK